MNAPVGERLKEHPFYYNIYALKPHARSMTSAAGTIIWTRSSEAAPAELDLHISATHIFDPAQSPTGGAIVLACAGTSLAGFFLLRMTESGFRLWSRRITIGTGARAGIRGSA